MTTKVLSNPVEDLKGLKLKAVVPNPKKLLLYIDGVLALDYDGTDTMHDEWHALHYKGKSYDLHIYYSEWCEEEPDATVILYALEDIETLGLQTDHSTFLTIPIEFGFDVREIFMKKCSISNEWFEEGEGFTFKGKWISFEHEPEDEEDIMRRYNLKQNVGKVKYLLSYHDGVKKHKDGSEFFDVATFSNKSKLDIFIKSLQIAGYVEQ